MQLTVESVKTNPSGKSLMVKASGKDYFAKTGSGIQPGMTIEAETKVSDYNGKSNVWIEKWKAVSSTPAAQSPSNGSAPHTPTTSATAWLPFASNTVAHAISAGLIQEPGQVSMWAKAAKEAFEALA